MLGNAVASSLLLHEPYGGVIPEIAARLHVETIWQVTTQALSEAKLSLEQIDAVAVTQGPGLPGALLIGLAFAKGLALALDRPLIPVDHLAAHLYAGEMTAEALQPPYVGLVVSGGHTVLCVAHADCRYELLGETKDDAVGEAFDKVAKLLGLGYPGGPAIDALSDQAKTNQISFPRTMGKQPLDFSFSGLKTAVYHYVQKQQLKNPGPEADHSGSRLPAPLDAQVVADVAASFQEAAVDVLVSKTLKAANRAGVKQIVVGGGVASNRRLRERFSEEGLAKKLTVVFPPLALCVDNGAMVAGIGFPLLRQARVASLSLKSDPHLCLS